VSFDAIAAGRVGAYSHECAYALIRAYVLPYAPASALMNLILNILIGKKSFLTTQYSDPKSYLFRRSNYLSLCLFEG
jgi:hypothetical protein